MAGCFGDGMEASTCERFQSFIKIYFFAIIYSLTTVDMKAHPECFLKQRIQRRKSGKHVFEQCAGT